MASITEIALINSKVIGMSAILLAWGVETFWVSKWRNSIKSLEFITINLGINRVDSDIKYLKHIIRNESKPELLANSLYFTVSGTKSAMSILNRVGAKVPESLVDEAIRLKVVIKKAKDAKQMLDEKINAEVRILNDDFQAYTKEWLGSSRTNIKIASWFSIISFFIGSVLLVISEFNYNGGV